MKTSGASQQGTRTPAAQVADRGSPPDLAKSEVDTSPTIEPAEFRPSIIPHVGYTKEDWDTWAGAVGTERWMEAWTRAQALSPVKTEPPWYGKELTFDEYSWRFGYERELDKAFATSILKGTIRVAVEPADVAAMTRGTGARDAEKAIRSLEKQIAKHEQKLAEFKANPTVRRGMEGLPKHIIEAQQQARIRKLQNEIRTFRDNIDKIKRGEL